MECGLTSPTNRPFIKKQNIYTIDICSKKQLPDVNFHYNVPKYPPQTGHL